jgi:hypothetical protein
LEAFAVKNFVGGTVAPLVVVWTDTPVASAVLDDSLMFLEFRVSVAPHDESYQIAKFFTIKSWVRDRQDPQGNQGKFADYEWPR